MRRFEDGDCLFKMIIKRSKYLKFNDILANKYSIKNDLKQISFCIF